MSLSIGLAAFALRADLPMPAHSSRVRLLETYGQRPLAFEENRGQTDARVMFLARGSGYDLFLTATEAVLALRDRGSARALRLRWAEAHPSPRVFGEDELPGRNNYLSGSDPCAWHTDVRSWARVRYTAVRPGVDLVFYGRQRQLEYDVIVAPGADPRSVRFVVDGAERLEIDAAGDLVLHVGATEARLRKPFAYQEIDGRRREVASGWRLPASGQVGFELDPHDPTRTLVIDPVLVYSTYLGGRSSDEARAIAVDPAGNAYVAGFTNSPDFPSTGSPTPAQGAFFITKLDPAGALVYSTLIGGASTPDNGNLIRVDAAGHAYAAGFGRSPDFPLVNPLPASQRDGAGDAFVLKLAPSGSELMYSTLLGGSGHDAARGLAVDPRGNAYVVGFTGSPDFPEKDPLFSSGSGFLTKLSADGSALVYSTRFRGGLPTGVDVDPAGHAHVVGNIFDADLPVVNAVQSAPAGSTETFVAKLSRSGSALVYSTFLGGSSEDESSAVAVDRAGNAYVTGVTISADFPLRNALQTTIPLHPRVSLYHDTFVTKLGPTGSLIYSTFLGGIGYDWSHAIAVDRAGNAWVTGFTESPDYPLKDPIQAECGPLEIAEVCEADAFVAKLSPAGDRLLFSTYLGGTTAPGIVPANDFAFGIATDPQGDVYVAGASLSLDFPTAHPLQPVHGDPTVPAFLFGFDGFVTKIRMNPPPVRPGRRAGETSAVPAIGATQPSTPGPGRADGSARSARKRR